MRKFNCINCVKGWGEIIDQEPYGDDWVSILKGYEPCDYCWQGLLLGWRVGIRDLFYNSWQWLRGDKNAFDPPPF